MHFIGVLFICGNLWADGAAKLPQVLLPRELPGIELGMTQDVFLSLRPNVRSLAVGERYLAGKTTDLYGIDPSLSDDMYIEGPLSISSPWFWEASFYFRQGRLAGIQLAMRGMSPASPSFAEARSDIIANCFTVLGREDDRGIKASRGYGKDIMAVLEWQHDGIMVRLDVSAYDKPYPPGTVENIPYGSLEILEPEAKSEAYDYVDVRLPRKEKKALFEGVGVDRIWQEVKKLKKSHKPRPNGQ